jgi:hypothetical protein
VSALAGLYPSVVPRSTEPIPNTLPERPSRRTSDSCLTGKLVG